MKKGVRIFGWIFLSLGIIALAVTLFFYYRQMRSQSQLVHRDADAIIEVRADKIFRELLGDALWNPRSYFDSHRDSVSDTTMSGLRPWNLGISLPANLYFFHLEADKGAYFTLLPIDNLSRLQEVLSRKFHVTIDESDSDTWYGSSASRQLYVVGNQERLVLAWNPQKTEEIVTKMHSLLTAEADLVEISSLKNAAYTRLEGDVNYWQTKGAQGGSLDFRAGEVLLIGRIADASSHFNPKPVGRVFPDDNILSARISADIRPWLSKHQGFLEKQGLSWQEIEPYIGNYWELQWKNETVLQADTIVTYDYDDNFNMVEKRELKSESVPSITLAFMASPHLLSYLPEKMFYHFHQHQAGQLLALSTSAEAPTFLSSPLQPQDAQLVLHYRRPDAIRTSLPLPAWLERVARADFSGVRQDDGDLALSGKMELTNDALHPIKQWIDLWR